jgi:aminoglycoside phosphotransferase (APT) family kinase protein
MTDDRDSREVLDLSAGVRAWCEANRPELAALGLIEVSHATAGRSNETIIARFGSPAQGIPGPRLVIRPTPRVSSFRDVDFGMQVRVQNAIAERGVPTASPGVLEQDPAWLGGPFIVMPFVDGYIVGDVPLLDPWMSEASPQQRRDSQHEVVAVLTAVHDVDWREAGLEGLVVGKTGCLQDQLDWWKSYLTWAMDGEDMPRVQAIFDWCQEHIPADTAPPVLLWGDPRLGNLVFGEDRRTRAVLDWDLAAVGPAEMDLAWWLAHEKVTHWLMRRDPLEGLAPHEEVAQDYAAAIGRPLEGLVWHEIFAILRSISVTIRQAAIATDLGVDYVLPRGEANPMVRIAEKWIEAHR